MNLLKPQHYCATNGSVLLSTKWAVLVSAQGLVSATWEDLCRQWVTLGAAQHLAFQEKGDWEPARRFWHGEGPEWDVVLQTLDERCVLLGEVKWSGRPFDLPKLRTLANALLAKGVPPVKGLRDKDLLHVVFVPEVTQDAPSEIEGVHVVTGDQVLSEMRRTAAAGTGRERSMQINNQGPITCALLMKPHLIWRATDWSLERIASILS